MNFLKTFKDKQLLSQELDEIEQRIKKLVTIQWVGQFVAIFKKKSYFYIGRPSCCFYLTFL